MDILELDKETEQDEEGAAVPIFQRGGDPYLAADGTPATITVLGSESKKYKAGKRAATKKMLRSYGSHVEPEDVERNAISLAAAAVIDWHGWEANGQPVPCTPENVKVLLSRDHILTQVQLGIDRHSSFFAKASVS